MVLVDDTRLSITSPELHVTAIHVNTFIVVASTTVAAFVSVVSTAKIVRVISFEAKRSPSVWTVK